MEDESSVIRDLEHLDEKDLSIRPLSLADYIGETEAKKALKVYIKAARARQESLDHVLLYGPPGLGKTTLAHIIANELQVGFKTVAGPSLARPADLAAILSGLQAGDVLFIDEIHRLPKAVEEILYAAMEDYTVSVVVGREAEARTVEVMLKPFTLIGATTKAGSLSQPLRDRFGISLKLDYYDQDELIAIVLRTAKVFDFPIAPTAAADLARRSRGTPRIVNRLYRRVRDYASVKGLTAIDCELAQTTMNVLGLDSLGLDSADRSILKVMIDRFKGHPVGVVAIAAAVGEDPQNILDVYEPYLIQVGLIDRTARGRLATKKAYEHLGRIYPDFLG